MDELKKNLFSRTYDLCDKLTDKLMQNLEGTEEYKSLAESFNELFDFIVNNKLEREYFDYIAKVVA